MIAPDPAPAGPRPATAARPETAREPKPRAGQADRARDDDFGSVLSARPRRAAPEAKRAKDAAAPATPPLAATVAPEAAAATALPAGAAVAPPAAPVEVQAVAEPAAAAPAPAAAAAAATAVAPTVVSRPAEGAVQDSKDGRRPAAATEASVAPTGAVAPAAAQPMPVAMPAARPAGEVPQAKPRDREVEVLPADAEAPVAADAPALRHLTVAPAAPGPAAAPAAAPLPTAGTGDGAGQGLVLHAAGPAPWQLTAEPAAVHGRSEPAAAQPMQPQAIVGQVAVAIGKASDRRVEIRLDPPELGRVQIHLTSSDGALHAVVLADRPETQNLLRRHAEVLARELGAAGYDSVSLDFAAGGDAAPGRDGAAAASPRALDWAQVAPAAAAPETMAAAPRRGAAGGLDVRL